MTHDSWYSTCVSTHISPTPLWEDCGGQLAGNMGKRKKKDEEEGRDKVQLREKPLTQKKWRTAGAGPGQGGCAVPAGNCCEQLGMGWRGGSVGSCDYNSWPCVRSSPSKGPRLFFLRAKTEGFCLPLRVPACKMCKMVPLFLEARAATAPGLGLWGFSCPCSRQSMGAAGPWMVIEAEG